MLLGEYPLAKNAIVDGDTIKVDGLDASLRLLGIDTEETFKSEKAWRAYEQGWERYLESEQAKTSRPLKVPTPLGMDAKHWAQEFFRGVTRVRLERDHPKEIRGRFNRHLVYVLVERDGEWVNYNVEAVRAGMSPYFTKYGYSRRFHDEFVQAEDEARAAKRGIWAEGAQCYQDYETRIAWWRGRAEFIAEFEAEAADDPALIVLTNWDAMRRLEDMLGEEVEVLGAVGDVRQGERGPKRVLLARRLFQDFPLIFWEDRVYELSGIDGYRGEYVRVRGVVTSYTDRRSGERQLQIEVRNPIQVRLPDYRPPGEPGEADEEPEAEWASEDEEAVEAPADLAPAPESMESSDSEAEDDESDDDESEDEELEDDESEDSESEADESKAEPEAESIDPSIPLPLILP
ncbi:MAG: thermonuclease family protein [Deltaproteobacteria bacterium]|nr:thermonuclease family protein [Deltaproteobacteria bacterium]